MRLDNLLPEKDDPKVLEFCHTLSEGMPLYVPLRPDADFKPVQCFLNVDAKIRRSGGTIVYGWEISQIPRIHLEARTHAVWRSSAGDLLDMTPEEFGQPRILFLLDARQKDNRATLQQRRFSMASPEHRPLVEEYWALSDESLSLRQSVELGAVRVSDPAIRARMQFLFSRLRTIRETLQQTA